MIEELFIYGISRSTSLERIEIAPLVLRNNVKQIIKSEFVNFESNSKAFLQI